MITGINTDIRCKGTIYHVQTEEKEPLIETLVYQGGAILNKKSFDYIQKYGDSLSQEKIRKLVEEQHNEILLSIKNGLFEPPKERNQSNEKQIDSDKKTLDELLIKYLNTLKKTNNP